MSLNSSYYSSEKQNEVIKKLSYLYMLIDDSIRQNFNVIKLECPLFVERSSNLMTPLAIGRIISFDSSSRHTINSIVNEYAFWLTKSIVDYEIENEEAICIHPRVILRDQKESSYKSLIRNDYIIEIKIPNNPDSFSSLLKKYTDLTKKTLLEISDEMYLKFSDPIQKIPRKIPHVTTQMLENEYPDFSFADREKAFIHDESNIFVLENPGQKLFSDKYHYDENPVLFDLRFQNLILGKNSINNESMRIAKISIRAYGDVLQDQIQYFSMDYVLKNNMVQKIIKKQAPLSIEIKIDVVTLALFLLKKAHISEVFPITLDFEKEKNINFRKLNTL